MTLFVAPSVAIFACRVACHGSARFLVVLTMFLFCGTVAGEIVGARRRDRRALFSHAGSCAFGQPAFPQSGGAGVPRDNLSRGLLWLVPYLLPELMYPDDSACCMVQHAIGFRPTAGVGA